MSATAASLTKLLAWRPGGYLRASGALFGWLTVRTLAQTVLFVLVREGSRQPEGLPELTHDLTSFAGHVAAAHSGSA